MDTPLDRWGGEIREWIDGGHTYRLAPGQLAGVMIGVLVAVVLLFGGAIAIGLSTNPSAVGIAMGAVAVFLPSAGIAALVVLMRRAGLFVDAKWVWRRNFYGKDVGGCERSEVVAVAVHQGSYSGWLTDELEENVLWLALRNGGKAMTTQMYFYSIRQAQLLASVLGVPVEIR